jgi:septal ring factor EnvC (AmiA/AmiB activator)
LQKARIDVILESLLPCEEGLLRWLACFALCASFLPAFSWAEGSSSSSIAPLPGASGDASTAPSATWERLDDLLNQLVSSAEDSSADSKRLGDSLRDARASLTELSARLSESATRAAELSSSLERCETSLELSEASLREARRAAARSGLELWLWRGAAVVGLAAGFAGLAYGLSR